MPKPGYQPPPPRQPPPKPGPPRQPPKPGPPRQPPPKPAPPCQPPPPPHRACAVFDDAIAIAAIHTAAIRAVTIFLITPPRSRCTVQLPRIDPDQCGTNLLASSVVAAGQLVDLAPHLVELAFEIVDLAAGFGRWLFRLRRAAGVLAFAPRERREHGKGALEHFHVSPHRFLQRAEWAAAEGLGHLIAEFFLLAGQRLDGDFEIARHQHLHAVAIEPDQLAQDGDRQQVLPFLVLLLENDLGQYRPRDLLTGLGVVDDEILAALDHGGKVFERHIGARTGVIEPPVGVFLDRDRLGGFGRGIGHWAATPAGLLSK